MRFYRPAGMGRIGRSGEEGVLYASGVETSEARERDALLAACVSTSACLAWDVEH